MDKGSAAGDDWKLLEAGGRRGSAVKKLARREEPKVLGMVWCLCRCRERLLISRGHLQPHIWQLWQAVPTPPFPQQLATIWP